MGTRKDISKNKALKIIKTGDKLGRGNLKNQKISPNCQR